MFKAIGLSIMLVLCGLTSTTTAFLTNTEYFEFPDWDHEQVSSFSGQFFEDVYHDVDVTVTAIGIFDLPTASPFGRWIQTGGHPFPGEHALRFDFSQPLQLVVKTHSVDPQELLFVEGGGEKAYYHARGSMPVVFNNLGSSAVDMMLNGTGFGLDPLEGAAMGEILTSLEADSFTVTHVATMSNKFERIMIGTLVPEPHAGLLVLIGTCGLLLPRWQRRLLPLRALARPACVQPIIGLANPACVGRVLKARPTLVSKDVKPQI